MSVGSSRSETPPTRAAHRPSRRADLVAAAIAEFGATDTGDPVSVARIVARTPMGASAFYYHFASVDELLVVVVGELFDGLLERFAVGPVEGALETWAVAAVRRQLGWIVACPQEARLVVALAHGAPGGPEVLAAVHRRLTATADAVGRTIAAFAGAPQPAVDVMARGLVSLVVELAEMVGEQRAALTDLDAAAAEAARRLVAIAPL